MTRKLNEQCGGCWLTNDQSLEKVADGILLDNTRFLRHAHLKKLDKKYYSPPEMTDRNPDQYWIFWPREAASKMPDITAMKGDWDCAFNLTTRRVLIFVIKLKYHCQSQGSADAFTRLPGNHGHQPVTRKILIFW